MRLSALILVLTTFGAAVARAEAPAEALQAPADEPRYRPVAISLFVASAVAAGFAGYFAYQSDNARSSLFGLSSTQPNTGISQAQAFSSFQSSVTNGRLAASLMGGALLLAGGGAAVWWCGSSVAVHLTPVGALVSGTFP